MKYNDMSIHAKDTIKAKFENVLLSVKEAEEQEKSKMKRIDFRITEDGVREKVEANKGNHDDTAIIVELSRSARYAR